MHNSAIPDRDDHGRHPHAEAPSDLDESHLTIACLMDAIFCSDLATGDSPPPCELGRAIRNALRTHRNWNGLTRAVVEAFGASPKEAAQREEWSRQLAMRALSNGDVRSELGEH